MSQRQRADVHIHKLYLLKQIFSENYRHFEFDDNQWQRHGIEKDMEWMLRRLAVASKEAEKTSQGRFKIYDAHGKKVYQF